MWKCIVCKQAMEIVPNMEGDDSRGFWPNVVGGTMTIHFGYGSRFDDIGPDPLRHQACICDDCYSAAIADDAVRHVEEVVTRTWRLP